MTLEPSNLQTAPFHGKLRLRLGVISPWRTTPGSQDLWAGRELLMCYSNIIHDYDCYVWMAYSDLSSPVWQLQLSQVLAAMYLDKPLRAADAEPTISPALYATIVSYVLITLSPTTTNYYHHHQPPPNTTTNHQPPPPSPIANYDAKARVRNKTPVISLSQNPEWGWPSLVEEPGLSLQHSAVWLISVD